MRIANTNLATNLPFANQFKPAMAVVVYTNEGLQLKLVKHDITNGAFGQATPISPEVGASLIAQITQEQSQLNCSLIPDNLLYSSHALMVWKVKRHVRKLFCGDTCIEVSLPNLLFSYAGNNRLSIYALSSDKRPDNDTKLFHAPLMNVYSSGSVCLGNVSLPAEPSVQDMGLIVNEVMGARHTHSNHQAAIRVKGRNEQDNTDRNYIQRFYAQLKGQRILKRDLNPVMNGRGQLTLGQLIGQQER